MRATASDPSRATGCGQLGPEGPSGPPMNGCTVNGESFTIGEQHQAVEHVEPGHPPPSGRGQWWQHQASITDRSVDGHKATAGASYAAYVAA